MPTIDELQRELARLKHEEQEALWANEKCSKCGVKRKWVIYEHLETIILCVNPHQEGYAQITMLLCDRCCTPLYEGLIDLGFKNHDHGSTSSFDDQDCPGYEDLDLCPEYNEDDPHTYTVIAEIAKKAPETPVEDTGVLQGVLDAVEEYGAYRDDPLSLSEPWYDDEGDGRDLGEGY